MNTTQQRGHGGEQLACQFLQQQGFRIITRNIHTRYGEIDIIATRAGRTHVIEVKLRRSQSFGSARDALTAKKFGRVRRAVQQLRQEKSDFIIGPFQYDFIAIDQDGRHTTLTPFWNIGPDDLR